MIVNTSQPPNWEEEQAAREICNKLGYVSDNTIQVSNHYGSTEYLPIWRAIAEERKRMAAYMGFI